MEAALTLVGDDVAHAAQLLLDHQGVIPSELRSPSAPSSSSEEPSTSSDDVTGLNHVDIFGMHDFYAFALITMSSSQQAVKRIHQFFCVISAIPVGYMQISQTKILTCFSALNPPNSVLFKLPSQYCRKEQFR